MKVEANYGCSARKDGIFDQSDGGKGTKWTHSLHLLALTLCDLQDYSCLSVKNNPS